MTMSGCFGPPDNASQDIKQMAAAEVLTVPPPGGVLLGRAEYLGTTSPGSAHDPGIAVVFAAPTVTFATAKYYKDTYPKYDLAEALLASAQQIQLVGKGNVSWTTTFLTIQTGEPYTLVDYAMTLKPAPPGTTVYVTVLVQGQPGEGPPK
jgi:hypothetical protein